MSGGGSPPRQALIALGANLGDPRAALRWARARLGELGTVRAASRLYRTAAVGGPPGQPDYLNAALALDTALEPHALLRALLSLEADYGRVREARWGPRTLDLDLLALEGALLDTPPLTLPHPRLLDRAFVLAPLAEVAPQWRHPVSGETAAEALARLDSGGVSVLGNDW